LSADRLPRRKLDRFLTETDPLFRVRWNARENHQKHEFLTRIPRILTDSYQADARQRVPTIGIEPRYLGCCGAINNGYRQPGLWRRKTPPQRPAPVDGSDESNQKILMSKNEHDMRAKGGVSVFRYLGESVVSRRARVKGWSAIKQKADSLARAKRQKKQKVEITKPDTNFAN
jgi:hypothetical protein